jgi:hypothetical protein
MALMQDGFCGEGSDRGEAPDDWVKTPGNAVIAVKAEGDPDRKKIKTRTDGVEKIEIQLDQGKTGLVAYQNNLARYKQLKGSYGSRQQEYRDAYAANHPRERENNKDGFVTLYIPKKFQPAIVSYGESGPSIRYPDLAYHHNVSFLQLRRLWNFCVAYAKKTSDKEPLTDLIVDLLNLQSGTSQALVDNIVSNPSAVSANDRTLLFDRLTWMGWNLVEGPPSSQRRDDPGERFDNFATPYLDPSYSGRMQAIGTLNGAIENMTRQVQADGIISSSLTMDDTASNLGGDAYQATVKSLRAAFQGIKPFNQEPLIAFDPDMWEYVKGSTDARFQLRK